MLITAVIEWEKEKKEAKNQARIANMLEFFIVKHESTDITLMLLDLEAPVNFEH